MITPTNLGTTRPCKILEDFKQPDQRTKLLTALGRTELRRANDKR